MKKIAQPWFHFWRVVYGFVLILSSTFYISLALIYLSGNIFSVTKVGFLAIFLIILVVYSRFPYDSRAAKTFLTIGSIVYFLFFIGSLRGTGAVAKIYQFYGPKFELFLNQLLLGFIIYLAALALIIYLLYRMVKFFAEVVKIKALTVIMFIVAIVILLVVINIDDIFPHLNTISYVADKTNYIIPFIGFSLALIHARYLILTYFLPDQTGETTSQ